MCATRGGSSRLQLQLLLYGGDHSLTCGGCRCVCMCATSHRAAPSFDSHTLSHLSAEMNSSSSAAAAAPHARASVSTAVPSSSDPAALLLEGEWSDVPKLTDKLAALECIDESACFEQCMSYDFMHELLVDLLDDGARMIVELRTQAAARDFRGISGTADGIAGAANNLHLPALQALGYIIWGLSRRGREPDCWWQEERHLLPLAAALTARQRTWMEDRLLAAMQPLIELLQQQYERIAAYLPHAARLAGEERAAEEEERAEEEAEPYVPPETNTHDSPFIHLSECTQPISKPNEHQKRVLLKEWLAVSPFLSAPRCERERELPMLRS